MAGARVETVEESFMPISLTPSGACHSSPSPAARMRGREREKPRLYGKHGLLIHTFACFAVVTIVCFGVLVAAQMRGVHAADAPMKIVALGDSLTAGFGV